MATLTILGIIIQNSKQSAWWAPVNILHKDRDGFLLDVFVHPVL